MSLQSPAIDWPSALPAGAIARREHRYPGLERLICAAICNAQLAGALLDTPMLALRQYEVGRGLSEVERRLVLAVAGARDIHEFAGHLHALSMQAHRVATVEHRTPERPAARDARMVFTTASAQ